MATTQPRSQIRPLRSRWEEPDRVSLRTGLPPGVLRTRAGTGQFGQKRLRDRRRQRAPAGGAHAPRGARAPRSAERLHPLGQAAYPPWRAEKRSARARDDRLQGIDRTSELSLLRVSAGRPGEAGQPLQARPLTVRASHHGAETSGSLEMCRDIWLERRERPSGWIRPRAGLEISGAEGGIRSGPSSAYSVMRAILVNSSQCLKHFRGSDRWH